MHLKISSTEWRRFYLGEEELTTGGHSDNAPIIPTAHTPIVKSGYASQYITYKNTVAYVCNNGDPFINKAPTLIARIVIWSLYSHAYTVPFLPSAKFW